jgi:hypothetical protein
MVLAAHVTTDTSVTPRIYSIDSNTPRASGAPVPRGGGGGGGSHGGPCRVPVGNDCLGMGAALVGQSILYRWPVQGWVLGKVIRVSQAAGFSHGVCYARGSALCVGEAASLMDAPLHCPGPAGRWVLLCPT